MRYKLNIPARINILGNPTDANEGDFATISAAVEIRAHALVEEADGIVLEMNSSPDEIGNENTIAFTHHGLPPLPYNGEIDLLKGAINRLYNFSEEFRNKLPSQGIRITTWTDVPHQSGLGGSSLFILLALGGLRAYYSLDPRRHNDYVLAELAQRVEANELGITCGYADRYVPLFGGIAYLDYRGKLQQLEIKNEPYVTYERLDPWVDDLPLVAISTGIQRDSGDVHGRMRPRYLQEHERWNKSGGDPPPLVRLMQGAWETAWRGKISLLDGDLVAFGQAMNENHRIVDEMMARCGFPDGAGWVNNLLIQTARDAGALGAKLTGAGGGGSVFALSEPGKQQALVDIWTDTAKENDLSNAKIYQPSISRTGLTVQEID